MSRCERCIHLPICEYVAEHDKNFHLERENECCGMFHKENRNKGYILSMEDTVEGMLSGDYKERFKAEYQQTKIRYERLKAYNTRIEAAQRTALYGVKTIDEPKHTCPEDILREQQEVMGHYLHVLEVRAVIENIEL